MYTSYVLNTLNTTIDAHRARMRTLDKALRAHPLWQVSRFATPHLKHTPHTGLERDGLWI